MPDPVSPPINPARRFAGLLHIALLVLPLVFSSCTSKKSDPAAPSGEPAPATSAAKEEPEKKVGSTEGMVLIPAGSFLMGDDEGFAHETPVHEVEVDSFWMDEQEVTNDQFAKFVEATGYVTEAENWKWSIVYRKDISPDDEAWERVPGAPWWVKMDGADWRHPIGPDSNIEGKGNLPVVQVSWNDAVAYSQWAGKRLPTEAEWEYAARGGLVGMEYAWGNELMPGGKALSNTWQGFFPAEDEQSDGWGDLSPVRSYPPNGYGLYDICGNVWEWCQDWYGSRYYSESPPSNPTGPESGDERIMRGGSWLCASNYCLGYRVSHRNKATPDSGINNTGFRCVISASEIKE